MVRLLLNRSSVPAEDLIACVEAALVRERDARVLRRQTELQARAEAQQAYRILGRMAGSASEIDVSRMRTEFSRALEHFTSAGYLELNGSTLHVHDQNAIAQMRAIRQLKGRSDPGGQRMSRALLHICEQL